MFLRTCWAAAKNIYIYIYIYSKISLRGLETRSHPVLSGAASWPENTAIYRAGATLALEMAAGACSAAASALEGAVRACFGAASALEMAAPACPGAASALQKVALAVPVASEWSLSPALLPPVRSKRLRARFGAASSFKAAVPASLLENAGLGYTCVGTVWGKHHK